MLNCEYKRPFNLVKLASSNVTFSVNEYFSAEFFGKNFHNDLAPMNGQDISVKLKESNRIIRIENVMKRDDETISFLTPFWWSQQLLWCLASDQIID